MTVSISYARTYFFFILKRRNGSSWLSASLFSWIFTHLSAQLSTQLSAMLSTWIFIQLFVWLFIRLSVQLSGASQSDSLFSLSYSMVVFSANLLRLFSFIYTHKSTWYVVISVQKIVTFGSIGAPLHLPEVNIIGSNHLSFLASKSF